MIQLYHVATSRNSLKAACARYRRQPRSAHQDARKTVRITTRCATRIGVALLRVFLDSCAPAYGCSALVKCALKSQEMHVLLPSTARLRGAGVRATHKDQK